MRRNLSVRSLLLLLAVSFTAIPVVLFGLYEATSGVERANAEADEINRRAALLVEKDIVSTIEQFRALFEALAIDVDLKTLRFRTPARVSKILQAYPQILAMLILNDKATSVAAYSNTRNLRVGVDYSDRDQVIRARETGRTAISGNLDGRVTGMPTIVFAVPLHAEDGTLAGFLNGAIPPNQFKTTYELINEQFAVVYDSFGRVVSSAGAGVLAESQVYTTTVQPIGWKVVVGVPRSVVTARSREAVRRAGLVALVCAIIGAGIASLVAFSTVHGLNNVGRQIQRMSAVDLRPIQIADGAFFPEELRTLVQNFNSLLHRAARTRHAEFEAISSVADTILIASPEGFITYVNEAGKKLFRDVDGKHLRDIVGAETAAAILTPGHPRVWKGDLSIKKQDGSIVDGFLSSTPIVDDGRLTAIVAIIQDITREKAAREAMVQSEKMITLGELVAGTSHELNNPLAIVTGYSDLLLEEDQLTAEQRSKVESIRKSALRASNVVHSLLAFARKRKPERVKTDINAVVEASIGLKDYDLRTSGIEIEKHLAASLPPVYADQNQIQQVLLNVINNAQDAVLASNNPPKIIIRTDAWDQTVYIRIEDSGAGISKTDLKKVFDPFFTTKPVGKGTGLGLSISYGIIREHGGEIGIQSQPGEGTQVSIELPIDVSAAPAPLKRFESPVKHGPRRFLVVDDEAEIVSILQNALSRDGSVVDSAATVTDAFNLASKNTYDYIVTDIKMPGGSGIDLYKQLCSVSPGYRRRVIFLTGDTSNPATIQFLEQEGLLYFSKPFDFQAMEDLLKR